MKKLMAAFLALSLLASKSTTAFAAEIDQDDSPNSEAIITTSISPTYTVSIPGDTNVTFKNTETDFGSIKVIAAQIDPDKQIRVSLSTDGKLENQVDSTKTIPYTVNDADGEFATGVYLKAGDQTDLTINITQADWNAAYAGSYSDKVIFTVSYEEIN